MPSVPRASGDEPQAPQHQPPAQTVFPARAGMSPPAPLDTWVTFRVPRASGDEPSSEDALGVALVCSPRERG